MYNCPKVFGDRKSLLVREILDLLHKSNRPPLIPPYKGGNLKSCALPFTRGGLGRGDSRIFARGLMSLRRISRQHNYYCDTPSTNSQG